LRIQTTSARAGRLERQCARRAPSSSNICSPAALAKRFALTSAGSIFLPVREPGTRPRVSNAPGVHIAWHPRPVDESSHPRYRDNKNSHFYKTDRLSPEETWRALRDELGRVLMDAQRAFWRSRLGMDPERVRWWHGAIFARHFPHDGRWGFPLSNSRVRQRGRSRRRDTRVHPRIGRQRDARTPRARSARSI